VVYRQAFRTNQHRRIRPSAAQGTFAFTNTTRNDILDSGSGYPDPRRLGSNDGEHRGLSIDTSNRHTSSRRAITAEQRIARTITIITNLTPTFPRERNGNAIEQRDSRIPRTFQQGTIRRSMQRRNNSLPA
jgi:hypothetical protein